MFICKLNLNFYSNFTFSLYLAFLLILQTSVHYLFFLLDLLGKATKTTSVIKAQHSE